MHGPRHNDDLQRLLRDADTPLIRGIVGFMAAQQNAIERIADSLQENTEETRLARKEIAGTRETIADHVKIEENFQTEVRTSVTTGRILTAASTTVIMLIGSALCGIVLYVWAGHVEEGRRDAAEQHQLVERVAKIEEALKALGAH